MFISRIDPKKGLEVLLRAMPSIPDATLDIYGTGVPSYVQAMQQLAGDLGVAARVRFHGHVDGEAKRDAFLNADLFVLPTHSENFGMVVAEALAHGVPAVVSHRAPWSELESRACGRWVANTPEALADAIASLRSADLEAIGARGRQWMVADFAWAHRARQFQHAFQTLTQNSPALNEAAGGL
jgi:glycosyltransferase involved in cell wall biosynthesis